MAYVNCTEVNELRWNDVCVGVGTTINNNNHGAGVSDDNDVRPFDFMTLCRVVNDLNASFSVLQSQVESVVTSLDLVTKSNQQIHEKVERQQKRFLLMPLKLFQFILMSCRWTLKRSGTS